MLDRKNQTLYSTRSIVHYYTQLNQLQPAEQTILNRLRDHWSGMTMLDIGVGGGRTTRHFSSLVKHYVGIDYSAAMIAACQQQFAASSNAAVFTVCDARDLSRFDDNSFDFILFSFNGIDYISHGDRLNVFQEVSRVGKPGGYFCFSSHNLQSMERSLTWKKQICLNPITTYVNLVMLALLRFFNHPLNLTQIRVAPHMILKDESHNFRLSTYYVKPQEQIAQLEGAFNTVQVFSWSTGLELISEAERNSNLDLWLYYLCRINFENAQH